jgi:dipeptidyl aminopeptidase/acylaminoacyl peptidase
MVVGGRSLAEPRLSPDGSCVVVHVRDSAGPRLVRIDFGDDALRAGPEVVLTVDPPIVGVHPSGGGSWGWWPDGSAIIYVASAGLYRVSRSGGVGTLVASTPVDGTLTSPVVSPDGERLACVIESDEAQAVGIIDGATGVIDVVAAGDPTLFRMDPTWRIDGTLTWHEWESPSMPWDRARLVTRMPDGTIVSAHTDGAPAQPTWSSNGEHLAFVADSLDGWRNVFVDDRPLLGGGVGERFEHGMQSWGPGQRSWCWSPDGARLAFVRNEGGFARLCVAELATGAVTELGKAWHLGLSWATTAGGLDRIAAIRTGGVTPAQLVVYESSADHASVRHTVARGPVGGWEELGLPEPEVVHWLSADGTELHGRIFTPKGAHGGVMVSMHGGPTDQTTVTFSTRFAYWLCQGWTIFTPDHRGSTGWGRSYQQAMNEQWGVLDVEDTADGVRHFIRSGRFDATKLVITGGSAGGFAALHLLGRHADFFTCGVVLYPVTDLAELDATTHRFERFYNQTLVGPTERYAERSPVSHAASLRKPLLLLHGDADPVVSAEHSRSFAAVARAAGAEVELVIYEGEGHGWKRSETTVNELERTITFLALHCPQ